MGISASQCWVKEDISLCHQKLRREIVEEIFERLDKHGERTDEVLNSLAFVNTNNAVVISQLCDVVDSLKELLQEVGEIKTCRDGKVCGRSVGIQRGAVSEDK